MTPQALNERERKRKIERGRDKKKRERERGLLLLRDFMGPIKTFLCKVQE